MTEIGIDAVIGIVANLIFIVITWWMLRGIPIERIFRKGKTAQIQLFTIFLTIIIASLVSDFVLKYIGYAADLRYLFP